MDNVAAGESEDQTDFIGLAADIVAAYVTNNSVPPADLPALINTIYATVAGLSSPAASAEPKVEKLTPAQIRKSITPDALISFIDGKPYKTLRRHLSGNGLTIEEYRVRYGLPVDYPSTAANYSAMRAELARSHGLGQYRQKAAPKAAAADETVAKAPKARGRKKATAAE